MPSHLVTYDLKKINSLIAHRDGESKLGEEIQLLNTVDKLESQIRNNDAKYVLLGIPEDIGISGNFGRPGARHAWNAMLPFLLNMQSNKHIKADKLLLLGHLDFSEDQAVIDGLQGEAKVEKAREVLEQMDAEITNLIALIASSGKKPIVVGGGHNNAYPLLKGCSLAYGTALNCINTDAHTDFRKREGRHSGNGFSYAYYEGFLDKYYIFGLQENYTSKKIFKKITTLPNIRYTTYEELMVRRDKGLSFEINEALSFVKGSRFGVEVDLDAIADMPSSAATPSGFSLDMVRSVVFQAGQSKNSAYLHLAEGAPRPDQPEEIRKVGKTLSLLIADFLRK